MKTIQISINSKAGWGQIIDDQVKEGPKGFPKTGPITRKCSRHIKAIRTWLRAQVLPRMNQCS